MAELAYNEVARHFDLESIPALAARFLPDGALALADLGCGDGPHFAALARSGSIAPSRPVYAVDLAEARIARVAARWPFIQAVVAPADHVPQIPDGSLDFVISTMVMEHVPDERRYLDEIRRVLKPGGRAYITTVFKRPWAWYFRKRDGESVLDPTHLREYVDLDAFEALVREADRFAKILALELVPLRFPLLDPLLFRVGGRLGTKTTRILRKARVPIPGYYSLEMVVER
ncbi:MAG: class I SAM-dependent methyltransferase [Deltaproteobacteria bacterium]|nr:class I SAM-dependent methyltransferase [Deltaproteobacteria bacterium]MDQ3300504.1 class I SAM-dependent methyltransferase [Myxococcota bacterium]